MLSFGNGKTGNIVSFDLPAVTTCPGATKICISKCYALKMQKQYANVNKKYIKNLEFSKSKWFVPYLIENIPPNSIMRIHVSGDFYSVGYIKRWYKIIKARQDVKFYTYTRSWRIPKLNRELDKLVKEKNFILNYSCDDETGKPPPRQRYTFLSINDTAPRWLRKNDLVFRSNHNGQPGNHQWQRNRAIKQGKNPDQIAPLIHNIVTRVCPKERGREISLTCETCKICIK